MTWARAYSLPQEKSLRHSGADVVWISGPQGVRPALAEGGLVVVDGQLQAALKETLLDTQRLIGEYFESCAAARSRQPHKYSPATLNMTVTVQYADCKEEIKMVGYASGSTATVKQQMLKEILARTQWMEGFAL